MGKSTKNSPDLLDVKTYVQAMDTLHGTSSTFRLTPDMTVNSVVWLVGITSVWPDLRATLGQESLTTVEEYRDGDLSGLGAALYRLCWRQDVALGKIRWKQSTLPMA